MPYEVKKSGKGYKVYSPNGAKSKKPLSKKKAMAQQRAIYANTNESSNQKTYQQKLEEVFNVVQKSAT